MAIMAMKEENYILHGPPLIYESNCTSVGRFVFDSFKSHPTFIGQVEALTGHEDTYDDMLKCSVRVALWLKSKNVGPGDVVSYCSGNHKESSITCFGILYTGAVFNPWASEFSIGEISKLMTMTRPKVIFCDENSSNTIKAAVKQANHDCIVVVYGDLPHLVSFADTQVQSEEEVNRFQCTEVDDNDVAVVQCSSGTTGLPKGVQISHKGLLIQMKIQADRSSGYPPNYISFMTLSWLPGLLFAVFAVACKSKLIVTSGCDSEMAWKIIEKHKPGVAICGAQEKQRE